MHYVLVFVPSIFMFTAFVLWGVIEGKCCQSIIYMYSTYPLSFEGWF